MRRQMPETREKKMTSIVVVGSGRRYHSNSKTPFQRASHERAKYRYGNAVHSNTNSKQGRRAPPGRSVRPARSKIYTTPSSHFCLPQRNNVTGVMVASKRLWRPRMFRRYSRGLARQVLGSEHRGKWLQTIYTKSNARALSENAYCSILARFNLGNDTTELGRKQIYELPRQLSTTATVCV